MNHLKRQILSSERRIFVGVDQTGAVRSDGRPKPLPAVILAQGELKPFSLNHLNRSNLSEALGSEVLNRLSVIVDCVLGLPEGVQPGFREGLSLSLEVPGFGREPARAFFGSFKVGKKFPRRLVEVRHEANSVFQLHPFQKNIQTGSFRIWKDLASEEDWFCLPFLDCDSPRGRIPIFEGYPSLAWRKLLHVSSRRPHQFSRLLKKYFPEIRLNRAARAQFERDPNFADAAVLALAGYVWLERTPFVVPEPKVARVEGWILGAD